MRYAISALIVLLNTAGISYQIIRVFNLSEMIGLFLSMLIFVFMLLAQKEEVSLQSGIKNRTSWSWFYFGFNLLFGSITVYTLDQTYYLMGWFSFLIPVAIYSWGLALDTQVYHDKMIDFEDEKIEVKSKGKDREKMDEKEMLVSIRKAIIILMQNGMKFGRDDVRAFIKESKLAGYYEGFEINQNGFNALFKTAKDQLAMQKKPKNNV